MRAAVESLQWWHTIDLGNGIVTRGRGGSEDRMSWIRLPASLAGRSVLDIGAFDGLFSFEAEKRGARRGKSGSKGGAGKGAAKSRPGGKGGVSSGVPTDEQALADTLPPTLIKPPKR